jgi:succinate-acetate transporter protein
MSEKTANPAPLGLLGFGITTVLLNFVHNARLGSIDGMILGMGIFYGGLAQIIAGIMEYGLFWMSFVTLNWLGVKGIASAGIWPFSMYAPAIGETYTTPWLVSNEALMAYFFMWGLFTLCMFVGTLKKNRAIQFVFMSLAILFFLLAFKSASAAYSWMTTDQIKTLTQIIGIEGIICGLSAVYLAIAEVLNETFGKTMLPICPIGQ